MKTFFYWILFLPLVVCCSSCVNHKPFDSASFKMAKMDTTKINLAGKKYYFNKTESQLTPKINDVYCEFNADKTYTMKDAATKQLLHSGYYDVQSSHPSASIIHLHVKQGQHAGKVLKYSLKFIGEDNGIYDLVISNSASEQAAREKSMKNAEEGFFAVH